MQMEEAEYESQEISLPPEDEDASFDSDAEMEEGEEETAKQRKEDADWQASGNSIDSLPEMQLREKGPERCMT